MPFTKRFLALLASLVAVFIFSSCSEYAKKDVATYSTGRVIAPEEITKIISELTPEEEPYKVDKKTVYYWTDGGSKFHIFRDCQSLSRTADEDITDGKCGNIPENISNDPCSFCLKRASLSKEQLLDIFSS